MTNKEIIQKKNEYIERLKEEKKALKEQCDFLRKQHRDDMHTIAEQEKGRDQLLDAMNAYYKETCIKYGEKVTDEGKVLGYRIIIPLPNMKKLDYLTCRRLEDKVIIAYMPNEKKAPN